MRRQLSGAVKYCWPVELLAGEHVPQPELGLQPAVGLAGDAAGDQRLRVDRAPVGKARHRVDVGDLLDVGRRVDRREQAERRRLVAMTCVTLRAMSRLGRRAADEIRHRDRHRLDVALRDVDAEHGARRRGRSAASGRRRRRPAAGGGSCSSP